MITNQWEKYPIVNECDSRIRLLLPNNGHLFSGTAKLLKEAGFSFQKHPRQLYVACETHEVDLIFVKGADIPWYLAQGAGDLGITGYDLLIEQNLTLGPWLKLGYGFCRLTVGVPIDSPYREVASLAGTRIASSHPNITGRFFAQQGVQVEIVVLKGALEVAPRLGVCQAVVGVVETGLSNMVNGIRVIADVLASQAILVSSPHCSPQKQGSVEKIRTILSDIVIAKEHQQDETRVY